jgi:homoserine dehydrogenase
LEALPVQRIQTRYQITLAVSDEPGVLAAIASVFAEHGVSVETVSQSSSVNGSALLTVMTHRASEQALEQVVNALRGNKSVQQVSSVIRVEGI